MWRDARENGLSNLKSWKRKKKGGLGSGKGSDGGSKKTVVSNVRDYSGGEPYWVQQCIGCSSAWSGRIRHLSVCVELIECRTSERCVPEIFTSKSP